MKYVLALLILLPALAFANEQQDAIQACVDADTKAVEFYAKHGIKREDFTYICKVTSRSKSQWDCVKQSIDNGNAPVFSEDQCFRTDPKTIKIEAGEEEHAIALCKESIAVAGQKNMMLENICDLTSMNHNADEWGCMKSMLVKGNDFSYSSSQCFINTDAQRQDYNF